MNAPTPTQARAADAANRTPATLTAQQPAETRKIIRTGSVYVTVASYDDARSKLDAIVQQVGGYVDSTQVSRGRNSITSATIVVRLPANAFGDIVPRLRDIGEVSNEMTNAADITAEYVDIDARLSSAKTLEKRLLELAAERNGTVDSVLAVERELARVRGEIEGYEGKLRMWNDQVAMSTLTLTISTKAPEIVAVSTSFGGRMSGAWHESVRVMRAFAGWFAVTMIALLPWALVFVPLVLVGRRVLAKIR